MKKFLTELIKDKHFIKKCLYLAIPVAVQGLLMTIVNFVDTIMIGSLGETSIAAVGLGNKVFFVFSLLIFGIISGSAILLSQYYGKRDIVNFKRVLGISLLISFIGSIFFMFGGLFYSKEIMEMFTYSEDSIFLGKSYISLVAISYPCVAITACYVAALRTISKVKVPVFISIIAIFVNILLNYLFIFGKFGFQELGVNGAAIGTLVARITEVTITILYVCIGKTHVRSNLRELFGFDKIFIKKYFCTIWTVVLNEFMWGLGVTMYSLVYGRMGDSAVACITITQTIEQLCIVLFQGISAATLVILGNELGANKLKKAETHADYLIFIQFLMVLLVIINMIIFRDILLSVFLVSDLIILDIRKCILVFMAYLPFRMFNLINITGILRSGGDTKASLFLDITGVWFVGIPLAFLGGMVLDFPIYFVYALVTFEEFYKFIIGFIRYKKKKWIKNLVGT